MEKRVERDQIGAAEKPQQAQNDDMFLKEVKLEDLLDRKKLGLISGGETTVSLNSVSEKLLGSGGRNQEMTLSFKYVFLGLLEKRSENVEFDLVFSSYGSDGIDGPTDAAGAYFIHDSRVKLKQDLVRREVMKDHLARHDSYAYFERNGGLIKIGPTGTNVSDLQVLLLHLD